MKSLYSRKLLVASLLLHCIAMNGMKGVTNWKQLTLQALRAINYRTLTEEDQLNYRLRFAELIENSDLKPDDLLNSRIELAELNAGTSTNLALEPHAPVPDVPSPRAPLQTVPPLPISIVKSFETDPTVRSHSTTPDLMPPCRIGQESPRSSSSSSDSELEASVTKPMPMPTANNPIFLDATESRSSESPLLAAEAQPTPIIRPHSAPPSLRQSPPLVSPSSPSVSSSSSSQSSSASQEVLMPSAIVHEESGSRSPSPIRAPIEKPVPSINVSQMNSVQLQEIDPTHFNPRAKSEYHERLSRLVEEARKSQEAHSDKPNVPEEQPPAAHAENTSNKLITTLEAAGVALAIWTTAEALMACKNISQEEWDNAKKWHYKLDLLARKTGNAMASRPGQVKDYIAKKFTNQ